VVGGDGGEEAAVELEALELDLPPRRDARQRVLRVRLQRLDVEDRDDVGEVGHVGLDQHRARQDRLAEEAAGLVLLGVAARPPRVARELARQAVLAARAQGGRRVHRIEAADRVVAQVVLPAVLADDSRPRLGILRSAHDTC
jgi:hypothetical protein